MTDQLLHHLPQVNEKKRKLEADVERLELMVQSALVEVEKEKSLHANTTFHCTELQADLEKLKKKCAEGEERRQAILAAHVNTRQECEELKREVGALH